MNFQEIYQTQSKVLSFEFYPPRNISDIEDTKRLMSDLTQSSPDLMTVTYGAGGGTREQTRELVRYIKNDLNTTAVSHITCVGHSREEIKNLLNRLLDAGVKNVLALRGDPPKGQLDFVPHPDGFTNSRDLCKFIRELGQFSIAVAGYPETHKDAKSAEADLEFLKEKVNAGAELIFTQVFFDPEIYFRFVEKAKKIGITVPIVPGVMPVSNFSQLKKFTSMCGSSIPQDLSSSLETLKDQPEDMLKFGIDYAIRQCERLLRNGAPGIHLYTLNKSTQIWPIVSTLRGVGVL